MDLIWLGIVILIYFAVFLVMTGYYLEKLAGNKLVKFYSVMAGIFWPVIVAVSLLVALGKQLGKNSKK